MFIVLYKKSGAMQNKTLWQLNEAINLFPCFRIPHPQAFISSLLPQDHKMAAAPPYCKSTFQAGRMKEEKGSTLVPGKLSSFGKGKYPKEITPTSQRPVLWHMVTFTQRCMRWYQGFPTATTREKGKGGFERNSGSQNSVCHM